VKPAPFLYQAVHSVEEALGALGRHGPEAKPLAGGQSLIPAMNFRLALPAALVDLNPVGELAYVRDDGGTLRIGAMSRQAVVERDPAVRRLAPLLAEALPHVAHAQIRNRGTLGGSVAHADPAAEIPAVLVALDARFALRRPGGTRELPAERFFTGLFATALAPGELLLEIAVPPAAPRTGTAFLELARRHGDYALAGIAASVTLDERGVVRGARIALLGVGEGPVVAQRAAKAITGEAPTDKAIAAAAEAAGAKDIDPPGDLHASSAYRRQLVTVLARRALARAVERAQGAAA
jgi:CO/xanthine dehydrogenase FAD-binding subunit